MHGGHAESTDFSVTPVSLTNEQTYVSDSCEQLQQSDERDVSSDVSDSNVMNSEDVDTEDKEEQGDHSDDDDDPLFRDIASQLYNVDQEMFRGQNVQHNDTDALSNTMDSILVENEDISMKVEKGNEVTSPLYDRGCEMLRSAGGHQQIGDGERMCDSNSSDQTHRNSTSRSTLTSDKSHKCNICNMTFNKAANLNKHVYVVHSGIKRFRCHICNESFEHLSDLLMHKRIHHSISKRHTCDVCQMTFSSARSLTSHKHVHSNSIKQFGCNTCNKKFKHLSNLTMHKYTHRSSKHYVCDVCNMAFHYPSVLSRHKASHSKPFRCDICNEAFVSRNYLLSHKRIHDKRHASDVSNRTVDTRTLEMDSNMHHGAKIFTCDFCNKSFRLKSYLILHRRIHTGEKPYVCGVCDKAFSRPHRLYSHKGTHADVKRFSCYICHKAYKHSENLSRHRSVHRGKKTFVYGVQKQRFSNAKQLARHKQTHTCEQKLESDETVVLSNVSHSNMMNSEDIDPEVEEEQGDHSDDDDDPLFRDIASQLYNADQEMFRGQNVRHNDTDALSNTMDNILVENEDISIKIEKGNEVTSPLYDQGCEMLRSAGGHQQVGDGERMCDSNSSDQTHRNSTSRSTLTSDKSHKCNICNMTFNKSANLNQHVYVVHSGIKRFRCHICNESFEHLSDLLMHKRIHHSISKHYACDVCQMTFSSAIGLESHKIVHSNTVKPFRLDVCNEAFVSQDCFLSNKRNHDKRHAFDVSNITVDTSTSEMDSNMHHGIEMFTCDFCNKSFMFESYLTSHRLIHTGETPYICGVCHKVFSRSSSLDSHNATHHDVKRFYCEICHKAYKHSGWLSLHKRVHTGVYAKEPVQQKHAHTGVDLFGNGKCNKELPRLGDLSKHKEHIDGDVKSFSCDKCSQAFRFRRNLRRHWNHQHRSTDASDKPYVCEHCNMSFIDVGIFNIHKNVHNV